MKTTTIPPSRQRRRRTTLSLTEELWDRIRAIEVQTGARPSVIVRRLLQESLDRRHDIPPPPDRR